MARYTKLCKNGRPGEYPGFFLSKCEQLKKKTMCIGYWIPCIMSCESRAVHMLCLLHTKVLYVKCRCAARAVIIKEFSYMHTIGQHKRLSLALEEGDPSK